MQFNNEVAFAESSQELDGYKKLEILSTINANRENNEVLIDKLTESFVEDYLYYPKTDLDGNNYSMKFSIKNIDFYENQSLFMWVYIPEILVQDLVVVASDGLNSLTWEMQGVQTADYRLNLSLVEMITEYNGIINRGWKLLELNISDAEKVGQLNKISTIDIDYSFVNNSSAEDDNNFRVTNFCVSKKINNKTSIVNHQDYVVYKEKDNFLNAQTSSYIGDSLKLTKTTDIFEYAIIGKQNLLTNSTGYVWSINLTTPTGAQHTFTFDKTRTITFEEHGYYLINIVLTTTGDDAYSIIEQTYNIFAEPFNFGFFQKSSYYFAVGTENIIYLTLSEDFQIDDNSEIVITNESDEIATIKHYIEGDKIFFKISTKNIGETSFKVEVSGYQSNKSKLETFDASLNISVVETEKEINSTVVWVVFWILISGFAVYIIILVVKSRKFDVK